MGLSWVLMSTQGVLIGTHGALMRTEGYSRGAPLRSRRSSSCGRGSSSAACTYARTRTRATTPTTAVGSASPRHSSSSQKPGSIGSTRAYPPLHSEDLATSAPQDRRHICTRTDATSALGLAVGTTGGTRRPQRRGTRRERSGTRCLGSTFTRASWSSRRSRTSTRAFPLRSVGRPIQRNTRRRLEPPPSAAPATSAPGLG